MLFLTTVVEWKGVGRRDNVINKHTGTQYVFDINNVSSLRPWGTGCRFIYQTNPASVNSGYEEIYCTTPYLTVKEEFDVAPICSTLELDVFTNNDITKPTYTKIINIYDFSYAWSHAVYPQYSWIVVCAKGIRKERLLADITLLELVAKDNQFDENNVQWFYFVDPEEVIYPEKFIRVA